MSISLHIDWSFTFIMPVVEFTYELGMDADPGPGTDFLVFDPTTPGIAAPFLITASVIPRWLMPSWIAWCTTLTRSI